MKNKDIILASNSARREELLHDVGIRFSIHSECCEEVFDNTISKEAAIEKIAFTKANAVFQKFPQSIVIGADTMVCLDGEMLGKPKNEEDAYRMLSSLSGKTHEVVTGVSILSSEAQCSFYDKTLVTFYELNDDILQWYIETKEPFDKAGAYGIQGKGKLFVKEIHGDYYNVMGLPIARLYRELIKLQKNLEK